MSRHLSFAHLSFALICVVLPLGMPALAGAQTALPTPAAAQGRNASITSSGQTLTVTFQPAEWPNAYWAAGQGKAWDWRRATLAFDAANPGRQPVEFSVRVDDDPRADGVHHCRTGNASLGPGRSGTFSLGLDPRDPRAMMGMVGAPPSPVRAGVTEMAGSGGVDASHIVAFQIFLHQPSAPMTLRVSRLRLLPPTATGDLYKGIVDPFGQFTRADWPGKVHSLADLARRRRDEARALAAAPSPPGRDEYGGWADGPSLPATGFFSTTRRGGRWWLVTPSGRLFLSWGVDVVGASEATIVHPRDAMFTGLPGPTDPLAKFYSHDFYYIYGPYKTGTTFDFYGANLERKYGPDYLDAWRKTTAARLKSWGFNTIGNWSDEALEAMHLVPYTARMDIPGGHARVASGSDYWGRMHDPFDPQFAADADGYFRANAPAHKDDPWCLGYFVDNELSWSGGDVDGGRYGLAYGSLAAPAAQPAKQALLAQLKAKYDTIDKFNAAWGTHLSAWDDLSAPYQASHQPNGAQEADMGAFVYAFARQYFTVVRDTLKKYDPNHLYLGCRFAGYTPEAVRAAAEVCDVVSFNIYRPRLDPNAWAFTRDLNRPCLIGEFHFGALDRGMFHPGLVSTPNQAARAAMFRDYIRSVVDNPAFVGAHWFQYVDEPLTGRPLDGENYNIGLVSVTDTPYPEMVAAARRVLAEAYTRRAGRKSSSR
ncbi:MAG: beta-galactosidase [Armatimonadetes bacterium]|nr:beta-galactosidase [Armatimonadota bacterium]